jgi:hypothetical protein
MSPRVVIRKMRTGRWLIFSHPQGESIRSYPDGRAALAEVERLYALWPQCASWDDFVDNLPDTDIPLT